MHMHFIDNRKAWRTLGLLGFCLLVTLPVLAQDDSDVSNRLNRVENELETLSRAVYKGETPPPGSYSGSSNSTDMEVRVQQLENDIREIRGKIEEQSFEVRQVHDELARAKSDIELRLNDLESKSGGGAGAGSSNSTGGAAPINDTNPPYPKSGSIDGSGYTDSAQTTTDSGATETKSAGGYQWGTNNASGQLGAYGETASGSPDAAADLYENAFSQLKNNNYDQAQGGFQEFMDKYPDHVLAGNAKYWLGETYYVRGKYDESARIFAEGYQKYPKSAKSADNLLKLGLSLDALGKKADACIALKQLGKENINGAAPVMRRAEQEMTRLQCE